MSPELDKKLCDKYPELFVNRHASETETAMCWGFEVEDGWYPLIDFLCAKLMYPVTVLRSRIADGRYEGEALEEIKKELAEAEKYIPVVSQVKEKFAGLRFYVESWTDEQYRMISFVEDLSYHVCEECGTMDNVMVYHRSWMKTLCPVHADQRYGSEVAESLRKFHESKNRSV